jgi:hypothetical protein
MLGVWTITELIVYLLIQQDIVEDISEHVGQLSKSFAEPIPSRFPYCSIW